MMNQSLLTKPTAVSGPQNRTIIVAAWLSMLFLSRAPQIILQEFLGIDMSSSILQWWLGIALCLTAGTFIWSVLRPLRGYFIVLLTVYGGTTVLDSLTSTAVWQSWFGGQTAAWAVRFFGERLGVVLLALLVTAVLLLLGQSRQDIFLTRGNWQVSSGLRWPGRPKPLGWGVVGPAVALLLAVLFGWGLLALSPGVQRQWPALIPLLPFVLLFAFMNAFGEEMAFRAGPLSQLWRVIGERQAVWLTAVWFGLGHFYGGIPSGMLGAIQSGLVGFLFGMAMIKTKGIAVPVLMHLLIDTAIYVFLAMTAV
ncbi:MAG: CPBP family intramembrane metalloprotease [Anaerolineales bacterium]|nr:CPBP family intramembrane metalloprotease [Anaerolineales bacterium]